LFFYPVEIRNYASSSGIVKIQLALEEAASYKS